MVEPNVALKMRKTFGVCSPRILGLAVSGGVDSMALTGLFAKWATLRGITLKAYIVDHKLRDGSSEEASQVGKYITDRFGITSKIIPLNLKSTARIEEAAREARRDSLEAACKVDNVEHLLMGHHLDDQIELFIQRLLAGSSWFGLAGMQLMSPMRLSYPAGARALKLVRPFLETRKADLIKWCSENDVKWWEDPTNADAFLTPRNLIRKMYTNEHEIAEPFRATNICSVLQDFGAQRRTVQETAGLAMRQLNLTRQLSSNQSLKRSNLTISKELLDMPPAILTEILLRIIAPLSPKPDDTILKKRAKIREVADQLIQGINIETNVLGVQLKTNKNILGFSREPPRKDELLTNLTNLNIYKATDQWSEYVLVDNRWYMRWKLKEKNRSKYFSVGFLGNPALITDLTKDIPEWNLDQAKNDLMVHPFFMWSNPLSPLSIEMATIVGFPTLGLTRGLEVQIMPKVARF